MSEKKKTKARYGSGSLFRQGRIWHVRFREVRRRPGAEPEYIQHHESTRSEDREYAKKFLNRRLSEVGGRKPTVVDPEKVSYEDIRDNFLARCEVKKLRSLKRNKDGSPTLATIPRLDKFFSGLRAPDITVERIQRFRNEGEHDGLSGFRLNRYVATLRAMFRWAAKRRIITPAEVPADFPTSPETNVARGALFIERAWYEPLRKKLKEPLRSAFVLSYHAAVRVEEMWRLRWRDIDAKNMVVTLPGEITKTGNLRHIFLPGDFALRAGAPDELVFPIAGSYRKQWQKACVAVGIGRWEDTDTKGYKRYVGPLLRHCRHTAIRNMSDSGLEEKRIMDISGHLTRATFDRYNIGREGDVAVAGAAVERFHRRKKGINKAQRAVNRAKRK